MIMSYKAHDDLEWLVMAHVMSVVYLAVSAKGTQSMLSI